MTLLHTLPPEHELRNKPLNGAFIRNRAGAQVWRQMNNWKISTATYNELGSVWKELDDFTFDAPKGAQ